MKLKNLLEQGYYPKQRRNPAADEYRPSSVPDPAPVEWDELMDRANNDPRYKVYSDSVLKSIKNTETGAIYKLIWSPEADEWESRDYDRRVRITADEIIAKAKADVMSDKLMEKSNRREDSLSKSYKVSDDLDHIRNEIMMNIKGAYKEQADYIMNQIKGKTISFNLGRDEGVAEDVKVQMSNRYGDLIEISIKIDGLWRELRSSIEIKDKEAKADVFVDNLDETVKLKNLLEQMDRNDPALMRARASKDQFQAARAAEKEAQRKRVYGKQRETLEDELWDIAQDLRTAYADRRNLVIDMEQEAKPEGDDVAQEYGSVLNTLDAEIEALKKRRDAIEARLSI